MFMYMLFYKVRSQRKKLRIKDLPLSTRPREKLHALGVANLSSDELVAILLGTGSRKYNALALSSKVLAQFNFDKLATVTVAELMKVDGIGLSKATRIMAALELGNRVFGPSQLQKIIIRTTDDVLNQVREYATKKQEHIIALYLNSRHELLQKEVIGIGTLNSALIEAKEVLTPALLSPCSSFIVVHNHPSGNPTPSKDDIAFTLQLQKAAEILGVEMIDHLIIAQSGYFSFRDGG